MRILLSLALLFPLAAFGELDDNTLTVTSSRTINLQPDQVAISVTATFEPTASLDDVLTALHSAGITLANLSNVGTYIEQVNFGVNQQTNEWNFVLQISFAKLSSELTALNALQQSVANNPTRSLNYNLQGIQVSPAVERHGSLPLHGALSGCRSAGPHTRVGCGRDVRTGGGGLRWRSF